MIGMRAPALVTVCEKSPDRSSAVGIVKRFVAIDLLRIESSEKKKNSLERLLLKLVPGMISGPPNVPPGLLYRYRGGVAKSGFCDALLKNSLASNCSCRQ